MLEKAKSKNDTFIDLKFLSDLADIVHFNYLTAVLSMLCKALNV